MARLHVIIIRTEEQCTYTESFLHRFLSVPCLGVILSSAQDVVNGFEMMRSYDRIIHVRLKIKYTFKYFMSSLQYIVFVKTVNTT